MISTGVLPVLITTFLASAVEAVEMVTIVVGVGATRGWRSTLIGAISGFGVLAVVVVVLGAALSRIPIGPLRLVIGSLLLVFGLQWFRKGIVRVAARGLQGMVGEDPRESAEQWRGPGMDWTAWFLSFKGVVLEGLEVAIIVVSFGAGANNYAAAIVGGAAALVIFLGIGFSIHRSLRRIPRSFLQLIVGTLLTTFGTFWSVEGLGVSWPASDGTVVVLLIIYAATAFGYINLQRRRTAALTAAA
jgi:Ca2+/H+ antiporter, TMEM165/GDT1 family